MVDDIRPLTRRELQEFLPSQRAVRAFENLFSLVPTDLEELLIISESALSSSTALKAENTKLRQEIDELRADLLRLQRMVNFDGLIKRVEILETLQG